MCLCHERQCVRVGLALARQRSGDLERLGGLTAAHIGFGEQPAGDWQFRRQRKRPGQVLFCLQQRPVVRLDGARQLERLDAVGRYAQHLLDVLLGGLEVALPYRVLRLEIAGLRVPGQRLLHAVERRLDRIGVLVCHQDGQDALVGRHIVTFECDRFAVGGQGLERIRLAVQQHVTLELPRFVVERCFGDGGVEERQGSCKVALGPLEPRFDDTRRRVVGHRLQSGSERLLGLALPSLRCIGQRERGAQVSRGHRVGEPGRCVVVGQFLGLPFTKEGAGQGRQHRLLRMSGRQRLAQLDAGRGRIAGLEQREAEQEARFTRLRVFLQGVLKLNDSRRPVVLVEVGFRGRDQRVGGFTGAPQQQD